MSGKEAGGISGSAERGLHDKLIIVDGRYVVEG